MSKIIKDLTIPLDQELEEKLKLMVANYSSHRILRKSVDARKSRDPHFVYTVEVFANGESPPPHEIVLEKIHTREKPIVIGAGPAGLFAALRFIERGVACTLLERGSDADKRLKFINRHWRYGELDAQNNVCFGEGGAGLYSDGKLITRIKSEHIAYVMNRLVRFGAPAEIEYLSNPHVGSDRIRRVIPKIRNYLLANGCEIHFDSQVTDIMFQENRVSGVKTLDGKLHNSSHVVLATGHSSQDVFDLLKAKGVFMEGKSLAMGLRIEHPQSLINKIQYRDSHADPQLGSANYKLTHHDAKSGIGVYSFCMCPGGYTISSGTDADGVVCNGMSNYHRNSPFANAAIVVTMDFKAWFGDEVFAGLNYRRALEKSAFAAVQAAGGKGQLPAQTVGDFLKRRSGAVGKTSSPSGVVPARLDQILPAKLFTPIAEALEYFERKMPGFLSEQAQLHGVESRTSCPVRVTRDKETLQSVSHPGLYPTGEGAGYAGGITSAAVDGIRVAEAIVKLLANQELSVVAQPPKAQRPPSV